ncbi:collagen-like protein [Maribacter antarcticus]|uniref:collagen-like protein n=1 Tax=Maribacter antarcticus TaxID=505250 RepID=UPI00047B82DC|nr:collagen-like protein [Maribacter antarcticus]
MKIRLTFLSHVLFALLITFCSCEKEGIQGPIGPAGATGEQGTTGPEGPTGEDGEALGVPGPQGNQGETGATGETGTVGTNGIDGVAGANGTNGADGNANVIASDWTSLNFSSTWDGNDEARFELSDANITQTVIDSYALLSYVRFSSVTVAASSVPFISLGKQYEVHDSMMLGEYVAFAIVNDKIARPTPPTNLEVRYVLIAPSSLAGKNDSPSLEQVQRDNIYISSYKDVMDYLGLDY